MQFGPSNMGRFEFSHPIKRDRSIANLHGPQLLCPLPRPRLRISSCTSPPAVSHTGELATPTPVSRHDSCRRRRSGRTRDAQPHCSMSSCHRIRHHRHGPGLRSTTSLACIHLRLRARKLVAPTLCSSSIPLLPPATERFRQRSQQ
ncbi:hypothetical protein PVAP13_3KG207500 [Panicum virgatum]|uniref:Uncharacterized protein n=1 Tax=Panicum virgatum TaxID=38727 RepID=A0A8T0UN23_PANVG|nr:hypothetical protein PVAP13_3KG207500 [Panicum virgatum]